MYSGYYQYEVNANLVGAEKLFEAMGYTLLADQTLVLDGPICPDQVTNVSRDAMAAYVECQVNAIRWRLNVTTFVNFMDRFWLVAFRL